MEFLSVGVTKEAALRDGVAAKHTRRSWLLAAWNAGNGKPAHLDANQTEGSNPKSSGLEFVGDCHCGLRAGIRLPAGPEWNGAGGWLGRDLFDFSFGLFLAFRVHCAKDA